MYDDTPTSRSQAQRREAGRALRKAVPRSAHAGWTAPARRADPVAQLIAQDNARLPDLVPIRHGRMAASPFTFLRGAAAVMARDLSKTPSSGIRVQSCGDAHLLNFGAYATPERNLVFDLNDFEETLEGPFEWDVKRLAASVHVAALDNGLTASQAITATTGAVASYRTTMAELASMTFLEVHYARVDVAEINRFLAAEEGAEHVSKRLARGRRKNNLHAFERLATVTKHGHVCIADEPPLVYHPEERRDKAKVVALVLDQYRTTLQPDRLDVFNRYRLVDTARKVVGMGSVGLDARIALFLGRDDQDPLFLQMKEVRASVLAPYAGASPYRHHGHRVVEGQRVMQAASDMFLGWYSGVLGSRRQYYVRQLRDMKGSVDLARMTPTVFTGYAALCGGTLARAHARSGDAAVITGYLGSTTQFDDALAAFAQDYAAQTSADHDLVQQAIATGRITAATGI